MTSEQWLEIKEVLGEALRLGPKERSAYIDSLCQGRTSLRGEVEKLLLEDAEMDPDFLTGASFRASASAILAGDEGLWVGRRIGPYYIVEQIGAGGMGEVYRASRADNAFQKDVALKLVRAGQDSSFVVGRFKHERQILAELDHPNIARLLDGGSTEEGLPYIVMELIEGESVTGYCDRQRVGVASRLRLFLQVCSAVQYAHQRLIIHRDIKPGNILVTSEGTPKLLDFGIAKIVGFEPSPGVPDAPVTVFRAMTPHYASPEQINGEAVTTATDVYSLGVVMYELLCGRSPYRLMKGTAQEIADAVRGSEPQRPSLAVLRMEEGGDRHASFFDPQDCAAVRNSTPEKLSKRLRGDLDNIIMMALRKEPQSRYGSVEQLAGDVAKHLDNLPVAASRGTARYRTAKFIARHRAGVLAAAAMLVTLLLGIVLTLHEARIAGEERERAEQRFRDMRELARSNLFEFHDAIQNLPGSASARNLVIQRALGFLDKLSRDEASDRGLMDELATGYVRVADLQGDFSGPGIGDNAAALSSFKKAYDIRESLILSSGGSPDEIRAECDFLSKYISVSQASGETQVASELARHSLALTEQLVRRLPADHQAVIDQAYANISMGRVMGGNGSTGSTRELQDAIVYDREAIRVLMEKPHSREDRDWLTALLTSHLTLAYHLRKNRDFQTSLRTYDAVWSMTGGMQGLPDIPRAIFFNHRSRVFHDMGLFRRAVEDERSALAIVGSLLKIDRHDLTAQIFVALAAGTLGMDEAQLGRKDAGAKKLDVAINEGKRLLETNPHELFYENLLLLGYSYQAKILSSLGNPPAALVKYTLALDIATGLHQKDPVDLESRLNVAKIHVARGTVLARTNMTSEAKQEITTGLAQLDELSRLRPNDAEIQFSSEITRGDLAGLEKCAARQHCLSTLSLRIPEPNN